MSGAEYIHNLLPDVLYLNWWMSGVYVFYIAKLAWASKTRYTMACALDYVELWTETG